MNPEIENLINLALADGLLTDKEREIIMRKAEALGEDKDEIEMILDGRILLMKLDQEKQLSDSKISNKKGNLKKCPSCGASTKSFQNNCEECGHEFRNVDTNSSINELLNNLKKITKSQFQDNFGGFEKSKYFEARAEVIRDFSIPTTKEDLIEFATKSIAEFDTKQIDNKELNSAWESKSVESISKLQIFALKDKSIIPIYEKLEKKLNEKITENKKRSRNQSLLLAVALPFAFFLGYLMYAFILSWFGKNYWPF
jgi:hypothetical protein